MYTVLIATLSEENIAKETHSLFFCVSKNDKRCHICSIYASNIAQLDMKDMNYKNCKMFSLIFQIQSWIELCDYHVNISSRNPFE